MASKISLSVFSDVLCVWAYIGQARIDEVAGNFADHIQIEYRFCPVFGDTAHQIGVGWSDRGGYAGFAAHLHEVVASFDHISLHPELWQHSRPTSSLPAHLLLKAVQSVAPQSLEQVLQAIRAAFFQRCQDISRWAVLRECLESVDVSVGAVRAALDSGVAHAALAADHRDQQAWMVQGSPTILLNEGRQKLYGNVGYRVIEANLKELLRSPNAGAASWC